jgi:hypothetical protein
MAVDRELQGTKVPPQAKPAEDRPQATISTKASSKIGSGSKRVLG